MGPQEPINAGRLGRIAAGMLFFVAVVVGAILLWNSFRKTNAAGSAHNQESPATEATNASPRPLSLPQDAAANDQRPQDTAASSQAGGQHDLPSDARQDARDERAAQRPGLTSTAPDDESYVNEETATEPRTVAPLRSAAPNPAHTEPPRGTRPSPDHLNQEATRGQPAIAKPSPIESAAEPFSAADEPDDSQDDKTTAEPDDDEDANPDSDRTPPVLEALRFDPPEISDGGSTTLLIQISDDLSGVKDAVGHVRSPSGAATLYFQAQGEAGGNSFTGRIAIPAKAETGAWYVGFLHINDMAGNPLIATYTATTALPGGTLRVVSEESDSTPPEVRRVSIEKRSVGGGENNPIRIEVTDDRSGVANITGQFRSASQAATLPFVCRATADPEAWEGEVQLPPSAECGEWSLVYVRVVDSAGNIGLISGNAAQVAGVTFTVASSECDASAPTLESFQLIPTVVSTASASEILVTAVVRDEGIGAASMMGWVSGPVSTNGTFPKIFFTCTHAPNDPEGIWTGKISVPQRAASGTWKVGLVRLQDRARNSRDYNENDPALAHGRFQVE